MGKRNRDTLNIEDDSDDSQSDEEIKVKIDEENIHWNQRDNLKNNFLKNGKMPLKSKKSCFLPFWKIPDTNIKWEEIEDIIDFIL